MIWRTEHRLLFGFLWLAIFVVVLLAAYLYGISLGLLGVIGQMDTVEKESQNLWLVAVSNTALLCLITFCARLVATGWFPGPLHPPFEHAGGGLLSGLVSTLGLGLVTAVYYRIARAF